MPTSPCEQTGVGVSLGACLRSRAACWERSYPHRKSRVIGGEGYAAEIVSSRCGPPTLRWTILHALSPSSTHEAGRLGLGVDAEPDASSGLPLLSVWLYGWRALAKLETARPAYLAHQRPDHNTLWRFYEPPSGHEESVQAHGAHGDGAGGPGSGGGRDEGEGPRQMTVPMMTSPAPSVETVGAFCDQAQNEQGKTPSGTGREGRLRSRWSASKVEGAILKQINLTVRTP